LRYIFVTVLTYILSHIVSKLLQITGQIFAFKKGVPLFNPLVRAELLNSGLRNVTTRN